MADGGSSSCSSCSQRAFPLFQVDQDELNQYCCLCVLKNKPQKATSVAKRSEETLTFEFKGVSFSWPVTKRSLRYEIASSFGIDPERTALVSRGKRYASSFEELIGSSAKIRLLGTAEREQLRSTVEKPLSMFELVVRLATETPRHVARFFEILKLFFISLFIAPESNHTDDHED